MKLPFKILSGLLILLAASATPALSEVEWSLQKTFQMDGPPLAVKASQNGKWLFVLTEAGKIHVYAADGGLEDTIDVGSHIDGIETGPAEDILFLNSRRNRTVQILSLDFIRTIDVSGSPFKGTSDAPVTVAVFSDFE